MSVLFLPILASHNAHISIPLMAIASFSLLHPPPVTFQPEHISHLVILECAQSHCSAADVNNLLQYYSALCAPPALFSDSPGKKEQTPSTELSSTSTQGSNTTTYTLCTQ